MTSRILLTQLRRIGDVLMTTPALAALRGHFPKAHIAFLTEAPSQLLFRDNPHLDEVILHPGRDSLAGRLSLVRRLRAERFDLVVEKSASPGPPLCTGKAFRRPFLQVISRRFSADRIT